MVKSYDLALPPGEPLEDPRAAAEERLRAARRVATAATDREDCAQLLDMLGLLPDGGTEADRMAG
ncbi:hypothetical protein [Amycolatopsis nigrescens]|uniref:hypothetical protein n=1 Tax=Amycolatopsis nigrescens TaxID=381445 RepID=UPI00036ABD63|nr:hypothetical protein [Amycolatopsis nigrescens]